MSISVNKIINSLIFALTTALFTLFIIFDTYTWGKYVLLILTACILALGSVLNNGQIQFVFGPYVRFYALFISYVFFSAIWAIDPSDSIVVGRTLLRVFLCAYAVFITAFYTPGVDETLLLKAVMWAGYIIALYALTFYGLDAMIEAGGQENLRLENQFANVNSIGLACALSCVLQINLRTLRPKDHFLPSALFMIPCIIVVAATQSRKAFVLLISGILIYAIVKAQKEKSSIAITIIKIAAGILVLILALYFLSQLEIFDGIRTRMTGLLNSVTGEGEVDGSAQQRNELKALGIKWFRKYPVCGVGIANPHILSRIYANFDSYLHNNYVELLCGGGIIGFGLYYSMYVYLFHQLWKYRNVDRQKAAFFALWLAMMLVMDYGMVSYYTKSQNYYLMIHFLNVYSLKRRAHQNGH